MKVEIKPLKLPDDIIERLKSDIAQILAIPSEYFNEPSNLPIAKTQWEGFNIGVKSMPSKSKDTDKYGKRYLIYHLEQAERWEDIKKLVNHPVFGERAKEALKRHEEKSNAYAKRN